VVWGLVWAAVGCWGCLGFWGGVALVESGSCGRIVGCDLGIGRECVNSGAAIGCAAEGRRHKGRVMLKTLVVYRTRIGQVLGIMAFTATVICFEYFFEWTWFAAIPVGVLAYITMPILWATFIVLLDRREPRSEQDPSSISRKDHIRRREHTLSRGLRLLARSSSPVNSFCRAWRGNTR
jgi:hypothetical protein